MRCCEENQKKILPCKRVSKVGDAVPGEAATGGGELGIGGKGKDPGGGGPWENFAKDFKRCKINIRREKGIFLGKEESNAEKCPAEDDRQGLTIINLFDEKEDVLLWYWEDEGEGLQNAQQDALGREGGKALGGGGGGFGLGPSS